MYREIKQYFSKRYPRWLEFANFQAEANNLPGEGEDLLNECLIQLLGKQPDEILSLYLDESKGEYCGLDYFVLTIIKLNAKSRTGPYKWKYHKMSIDKNIQADEARSDEFSDPDQELQQARSESHEYICHRSRQIRDTLNSLKIPENEKEVFSSRVLNDQPLTRLKCKKNPYPIFKKLKRTIKAAVVAKEIEELIKSSISKFPDRYSSQKAALELVYIHGFHPRELEINGISFFNTLYPPAKNHLKKLIQKQLQNEN